MAEKKLAIEKEAWIAAYRKAQQDTNAPASSGKVCAIATTRHLRDLMLERGNGKPMTPEQIKEFFKQLITGFSHDGVEWGFASNASAAAKAAGLAVENKENLIAE